MTMARHAVVVNASLVPGGHDYIGTLVSARTARVGATWSARDIVTTVLKGRVLVSVALTRL